MNLTFQELKSAASELPIVERADLAQFLLHSLDEQPEEGAHAEWLAVAEERAAELADGKAVGIPAEEVLKNLLPPSR
jgi:putative addiction module component (TIGR02574 family)